MLGADAFDDLDAGVLRADPTRRGPIPLAVLQQAASLIDGKPLDLIMKWEAEDNPRHIGGRPSSVSMRAVLIVWLAIIMEEQAPFLTNVAEAFYDRLTPKTADFLGLPVGKGGNVDEWYERARRATGRLLRLIDAFPVKNRQKRPTKAEWNDNSAERKKNKAELAKRYRRCDELMNAIVARTYAYLPKRLRTDAVSLCIDATPLELFAKGISVTRLEKFTDERLMSIEPDAGFYARDTRDHADDGKQKRSRTKYAYEMELSVLTSNDPDVPNAVPHIVLGVGFHAPAFGPGQAARDLFEQVVGNGFKLDHVIGDRGYFPAADPEILQSWLRAQGAKLVMDYRKSDLGLKVNYQGAIQVEGNWYSPSMPQILIDATLTRRAEKKALKANRKAYTREEYKARKSTLDETWEARIAERTRYLLRRKELPTADGTAPWMCPAVGPNATLDCAYKPAPRLRNGHVPLKVLNAPPNPDKICTNKSSLTIPGHIGAKRAQEYQYRSPLWKTFFGQRRNVIESFNDYVKNPAQYALGDRARRRLRGRTAQYLLASLTIAAANLSKIRDFISNREIEADDLEHGLTAPEARSRRSRRGTAVQRHRDHFNRAERPSRSGAKPPARRLA